MSNHLLNDVFFTKNAAFILPTELLYTNFFIKNQDSLENEVIALAYERLRLNPSKEYTISYTTYPKDDGFYVDIFVISYDNLRSILKGKKYSNIFPMLTALNPNNQKACVILVEIKNTQYACFYYLNQYITSYILNGDLDQAIFRISSAYGIDFNDKINLNLNQQNITNIDILDISNISQGLNLSPQEWRIKFFRKPLFILTLIMFLGCLFGLLFASYDYYNLTDKNLINEFIKTKSELSATLTKTNNEKLKIEKLKTNLDSLKLKILQLEKESKIYSGIGNKTKILKNIYIFSNNNNIKLQSISINNNNIKIIYNTNNNLQTLNFIKDLRNKFDIISNSLDSKNSYKITLKAKEYQ